MTEMLNNYSYVVAWGIYILAGIGCCVVWWKLTSYISHKGWRELQRGAIAVLIFTPWYTAESPDFFAPASLVLLMDLILAGADAGMQGGPALLSSAFLMLVVLMARLIYTQKFA